MYVAEAVKGMTQIHRLFLPCDFCFVLVVVFCLVFKHLISCLFDYGEQKKRLCGSGKPDTMRFITFSICNQRQHFGHQVHSFCIFILKSSVNLPISVALFLCFFLITFVWFLRGWLVFVSGLFFRIDTWRGKEQFALK